LLDRLASDLALGLALLVALLVSAELRQRERVTLARTQTSALTAEIEAYRSNTGFYPASLSDLGYRLYEVFDDATPRDPWQRVYRYTPKGDTFVLSSEGAPKHP
jgi:hypothetical protein